MIFHETSPGETLTSIAKDYGTTVQMLIDYNGIPNPENLVVGQCIVIVYPEIIHTVTGGENLYSIAQYYDVSLNELYRNNPKLRAGSMIYPGESLVIKLEDDIIGDFETGGYTYTDSNIGLIESTMPFMNYLMPFTYGFSATGELTALEDEKFIEIAHKYRRKCFFHLSTLTPEGYYSDENAKAVLASDELQNTLIDRILGTIESKGYDGLDIDFEYISAEYAERYAEFIYKARERLNSYGYEVFAALAPKTSDEQKGVLYEGHLYKEIGDAANAVLLMTYEWGYTHPQRRNSPPKKFKKKRKAREKECQVSKCWRRNCASTARKTKSRGKSSRQQSE